MKRFNRRKLAIGLVLAFIAVTFFLLGFQDLLTFEAIKGSQAQARNFYHQQPFLAVAGFMAVYLLIVPLNLPGAALLALMAGAVFGIAGVIIVSFASSLSATLACGLSRYLLRDLVRAKFPQVAATVDQGMKREGTFYLFSMRLIPVIPYFMINLVMGLTAIPLRTFYWVSQLGMLPGTFVFVNAGQELGRLTTPGDLFSPRLLAAFALLGLLPLLASRLLGFFRAGSSGSVSRTRTGADLVRAFTGPPGESLRQKAATVAAGCSGCKACAAQCAFLGTHGLPGEIAASVLKEQVTADPFACSLCNLCTAVCPEELAPGALFLAMRRQAVTRSAFFNRPYRTILAYEQRGSSSLFSWYALPAGCRSVFFPGCSLPATRPDSTWNLYQKLQVELPSLGIVLDCCHKPSHDLGRQKHFQAMFKEMTGWLESRGVREILVACPSCYRVFADYGGSLQVRSVWEHLAENINGSPAGEALTGTDRLTLPALVSIHDPCPLRNQSEVHQAVRRLLRNLGLKVREMRSSGQRTLCCGEGGSVGFLRQELAGNWGRLRRQQAGDLPVITYCAGCAGFLDRAGLQTIHLADLLADPAAALAGKMAPASSPWTYLHRLRLKRRLRNHGGFNEQRVRNHKPAGREEYRCAKRQHD